MEVCLISDALKSKSDRTDFVCIGFMTFCPEWLTGNQNLDASNFMYYVGLLGVLQYAVGGYADLCDVGFISGYV